MTRKTVAVLAGVMLAGAGSAVAQTTGMPSFNAPYRSFTRHEFGVALSFPDPGDFALEGQYRYGYRTWDIGFRGGIFDPGIGDAVFLVGVEGRNRVITHSEQFPLDGAVVVGVGGQIVSGGSALLVPAGLSLGRRIDIEDSDVKITPYVEPTVFLESDGGTDLFFTLGLGTDIRLSPFFDARVSVGIGDLEGVSIGAVWIR